jgi:uncharacterized repeat protein (TIGR03803 family)
MRQMSWSSIAGLLFFTIANGQAQIFSVLHSFTNTVDGANPYAGLTLSGTTLYGTTASGGNTGNGTVFKLNTDGTSFTNLYSFDSSNGAPYEGLVLNGISLYGISSDASGTQGNGTLFKISTEGTGFTNVYNFNGSAYSPNELLSYSNMFFGTALYGGNVEAGSVFAINIDGTGFTNLYGFTGGSDGYSPNPLVLSGHTLLGTTVAGGNVYLGNLFAINTDGTGFTNLFSFGAGDSGTTPRGTLGLSGNTLYGTTVSGGDKNNGTVFRINTDGNGYTNLYSFTALTSGTNGDGANPYTGLVLSGNTLYGMTYQGGNGGYGTVFKVNTDGTGFTNLYNFTSTTAIIYGNGVDPHGSLIFSGNALYGTTEYGGNSGNGMVFALALPLPSLNIQLNGNSVILTWNDSSFSLQAAPTGGGVYTNVPNATSPYTNSVTGSQEFFRLRSD